MQIDSKEKVYKDLYRTRKELIVELICYTVIQLLSFTLLYKIVTGVTGSVMPILWLPIIFSLIWVIRSTIPVVIEQIKDIKLITRTLKSLNAA